MREISGREYIEGEMAEKGQDVSDPGSSFPREIPTHETQSARRCGQPTVSLLTNQGLEKGTQTTSSSRLPISLSRKP